jgi:hypothetical protein
MRPHCDLVTSRSHLMVGVATEICADSTAILTLVGLNLVNHPQEAANRARDSKKDRLAKVEVAERGG